MALRRYHIEPDHATRGAHSIVSFVYIVDMKTPLDDKSYIWEVRVYLCVQRAALAAPTRQISVQCSTRAPYGFSVRLFIAHWVTHCLESWSDGALQCYSQHMCRYPFDTGCLPLSCSDNSGVNGDAHRGFICMCSICSTYS
jgi:hypothetical protein